MSQSFHPTNGKIPYFISPTTHYGTCCIWKRHVSYLYRGSVEFFSVGGIIATGAPFTPEGVGVWNMAALCATDATSGAGALWDVSLDLNEGALGAGRVGAGRVGTIFFSAVFSTTTSS